MVNHYFLHGYEMQCISNKQQQQRTINVQSTTNGEGRKEMREKGTPDGVLCLFRLRAGVYQILLSKRASGDGVFLNGDSFSYHCFCTQ